MELKQNPERIRKVILALLDKAESGDMTAIREVCDRVDGKVVNQVNAEIKISSATTEFILYKSMTYNRIP